MITIGKTTYKTNRVDIFAHHAKCTGKHKPVKPKKTTEKRVFPVYREGMSTAQYVEWYENVNKTLRKWNWEPLSTAPTVPSGEDAAWEVEDAAPDLFLQPGGLVVDVYNSAGVMSAPLGFVYVKMPDVSTGGAA